MCKFIYIIITSCSGHVQVDGGVKIMIILQHTSPAAQKATGTKSPVGAVGGSGGGDDDGCSPALLTDHSNLCRGDHFELSATISGKDVDQTPRARTK